MTNLESSRVMADFALGNPGKGSYVLLSQLPEAETINTGSLKAVHFRHGYYAYVGSALGGFRARLNRHSKRGKKPHWHIDYLLEKASITGLILAETRDRVECTMAQALSHKFDSITGFGASDCQCRSHLFFATGEITEEIVTLLDALSLELTLVRPPFTL